MSITQVLHRAVYFLLCCLLCILTAVSPPKGTSTLSNFWDDTSLLPLLYGAQSDNGCAQTSFVEWYDDNYLDLNVKKIKELIIDFRRDRPELIASTVHREKGEIVLYI